MDRDRRVRRWKVLALTACFAGAVALNIGKGSVPCASPQYWGVWAATVAWILLFFLAFRSEARALRRLI
jgi:hypothetical protein